MEYYTYFAERKKINFLSLGRMCSGPSIFTENLGKTVRKNTKGELQYIKWWPKWSVCGRFDSSGRSVVGLTIFSDFKHCGRVVNNLRQKLWRLDTYCTFYCFSLLFLPFVSIVSPFCFYRFLPFVFIVVPIVSIIPHLAIIKRFYCPVPFQDKISKLQVFRYKALGKDIKLYCNDNHRGFSLRVPLITFERFQHVPRASLFAIFKMADPG